MQVELIQKQLNLKGYGPLLEDGILGANTLRAIKNFQADNGLTPDGIVGVKTKAILLCEPVQEIRKMDKAGLDFLVNEEGLVLEPYYDSVGIATIGVGCTYYENGTKVKITDPPITVKRAYSLFSKLLKNYEQAVYSTTRDDINQSRFNALTSLCFNIGVAAFKKSTVLKRVNNNHQDPLIRNGFLMWRNAGGKPILLKRRQREANLYFKPC